MKDLRDKLRAAAGIKDHDIPVVEAPMGMTPEQAGKSFEAAKSLAADANKLIGDRIRDLSNEEADRIMMQITAVVTLYHATKHAMLSTDKAGVMATIWDMMDKAMAKTVKRTPL